MFHPTFPAKKKENYFSIFKPKMYLMAHECPHLTKNTLSFHYRKTIAVYLKNQTKHIKTLHEQNGDPINMKAVGASTNR
jgi:hypothetical protein